MLGVFTPGSQDTTVDAEKPNGDRRIRYGVRFAMSARSILKQRGRNLFQSSTSKGEARLSTLLDLANHILKLVPYLRYTRRGELAGPVRGLVSDIIIHVPAHARHIIYSLLHLT